MTIYKIDENVFNVDCGRFSRKVRRHQPLRMQAKIHASHCFFVHFSTHTPNDPGFRDSIERADGSPSRIRRTQTGCTSDLRISNNLRAGMHKKCIESANRGKSERIDVAMIASKTSNKKRRESQQEGGLQENRLCAEGTVHRRRPFEHGRSLTVKRAGGTRQSQGDRQASCGPRSARKAVEEKDRAAREDAEQRKAHCHSEIHAGSGTVSD